jgi:hypothetical protein
MIMIGIGSALLGAALGLRLNVLVLLPIIFFGLIIFTTFATLEHIAMSIAALDAAIYVVALQLGYLGGLFTRFVLVASRIQTKSRTRSSVVRG